MIIEGIIMKERILKDLRKMGMEYFHKMTDVEIYKFICDIFYLRNNEYQIARECSFIIFNESR